MLEPMTFPATISVEPLAVAMTDEMSSGKEVPTATMITPRGKRRHAQREANDFGRPGKIAGRGDQRKNAGYKY
jgi:hypothetical protein